MALILSFEYSFVGYKTGLPDGDGYVILQLYKGKEIGRTFVPACEYDSFCRYVGVIPEIYDMEAMGMFSDLISKGALLRAINDGLNMSVANRCTDRVGWIMSCIRNFSVACDLRKIVEEMEKDIGSNSDMQNELTRKHIAVVQSCGIGDVVRKGK